LELKEEIKLLKKLEENKDLLSSIFRMLNQKNLNFMILLENNKETLKEN
jgi:hypothetical protein